MYGKRNGKNSGKNKNNLVSVCGFDMRYVESVFDDICIIEHLQIHIHILITNIFDSIQSVNVFIEW